jgi:hypothetical protein
MLDEDSIKNIMLYLPLEDIGRLCEYNQFYNNICNNLDRHFWSQKYVNDFDMEPQTSDIKNEYQVVYYRLDKAIDTLKSLKKYVTILNNNNIIDVRTLNYLPEEINNIINTHNIDYNKTTINFYVSPIDVQLTLMYTLINNRNPHEYKTVLTVEQLKQFMLYLLLNYDTIMLQQIGYQPIKI